MKKTFTLKFKQQAELLRASLEAMPLQHGCAHLFQHEIDAAKFIKYLAVTRHGMPECLLSTYADQNKKYIQLNYNAMDEDRYFQFSVALDRNQLGFMHVLACTRAGLREAHAKNMKFMEAFDANIKYMIEQIRRKPVMSKAYLKLQQAHEAFVAGISVVRS